MFGRLNEMMYQIVSFSFISFPVSNFIFALKRIPLNQLNIETDIGHLGIYFSRSFRGYSSGKREGANLKGVDNAVIMFLNLLWVSPG